MNLYPILFIYIICLPALQAQQVTVKGTLKSQNTPLGFAHLMAIPQEKAAKIATAVTDDKGNYNLILKTNTHYEVTARYLGYEPTSFEIFATTDSIIIKNINLKPLDEELHEVIVIEKPPPVIVKYDTIVFDVDSFINGDERKLREVLEKLPGVEVDKEGRVFVKGQQVKRLLVENKPFFDGKTSLAVKYIPADAVDKVEVLENYNKVGFLQGTSSGDELAINIRLKEDKKRFAFGELKAGTDAQERYLVHPNLFYYAPNTNINFIGDVNNVGVAPFTFMDYFEFEGGISKLLEGNSPIMKQSSSVLYSLMNIQAAQNTIDRFGALNITQDFGSKVRLSAYAILSDKVNTYQSDDLKTYFISDSLSLSERQTSNSQSQSTIGLAKMTLDITPNSRQHITYQAFGKNINLNNTSNNTSNSLLQNVDIQALNSDADVAVNQELNWHLQFSNNHIGSLVINSDISRNRPMQHWQIDGFLFQSFIPIQEDSIFTIFQNKTTNATYNQFLYKHNYILTPQNHFYFKIGYNHSKENITTSTYQEITDAPTYDFENDGFGNQLDFIFKNPYIDVSYKFKKRLFDLNIGVAVHQYDWQSQQDVFLKNKKIVVLPNFNTTATIRKVGKIGVYYHINSSFPSANRFISRFVLNSFNTASTGNPALENELNHSIGIDYTKANLIKRSSLYATLSYQQKVNSIQDQVQFEGINQFSMPIMIHQPQHQWRLRGRWKKEIKKIDLTPSISVNYGNYLQFTNRNEINTQRVYTTIDLAINTKFDHFPNFKLSYEQQQNYFIASTRDISVFKNYIPSFSLKYRFLKDFLLTVESTSTIFQTNSINHFNQTHLTLFYQKKDSPFAIELMVRNLFDIQTQWQGYFSDFTSTETQTFVMPRVLLASFIYEF